MKLQRLVLVAATFQSCIEVVGLVLSFLCPLCTEVIAFDELHNDRPIIYEDTSWVSDDVKTYKDYSRITQAHPVIYILPHVWSGVIPRMLDGYKCIVADYLVTENLDKWNSIVSSAEKNPWDHIIVSLSKLHKEMPRKLKMLQKSLDNALEMRRLHCAGRNETLVMSERVFMGLHLFFCLFTLGVTICSQVALLYLPWMILTGYEIAGNIAVFVTFLTSPGYPYLTALVCAVKVICLRWVFVHVIRRQMVFCIEQREKKAAASQQLKDDQERKLLRSQLSVKGKVRLSRVFGNYT